MPIVWLPGPYAARPLSAVRSGIAKAVGCALWHLRDGEMVRGGVAGEQHPVHEKIWQVSTQTAGRDVKCRVTVGAAVGQSR